MLCSIRENVQFVIWVIANNDVQTLWQGPVLGWNALPSLSAHDDRILSTLRCILGYMCKEPHVFTDVPWQTPIFADPIDCGSGDDDGETDHGR